MAAGGVIVDAVVVGVVTLEPLMRGQKVEKRPDGVRETGSGENVDDDCSHPKSTDLVNSELVIV